MQDFDLEGGEDRCVGSDWHATKLIRECLGYVRSEGTYKPELNPSLWKKEVSARGWQGAPKLDCVAVWFFDRNSKVTVSPIPAVILGGLKANFPSAPTEYDTEDHPHS
jgi:hypothetical protein